MGNNQDNSTNKIHVAKIDIDSALQSKDGTSNLTRGLIGQPQTDNVSQTQRKEIDEQKNTEISTRRRKPKDNVSLSDMSHLYQQQMITQENDV